MPTTNTSVGQVRRERLGLLGSLFAAGVAGLFKAAGWFVSRTWRRALPAYWVGAELAIVWLAGPLGISWTAVGVLVLAVLAVTAGWPAGSVLVRAWRATIVVVLGGFAVGTVASGPLTLTSHPTVTVFGPTLAAALLGWPWWFHLRRQVVVEIDLDPEPLPVRESAEDPLTAYWARRWQHEVVGEGVCKGTRLVRASSPRPGVTDAIIRLAPGQKPAMFLKKGPEVEVALDLDEGAVGWRSTGKAAKLRVIMVEQSYIARGVPWTGPTHRGGRCQATTFTDGSPGLWTFSRPGYGVLNGLVVGSTGTGKSRALGVLITNLLDGGWMVVVGDPQHGQSLPDWRDAVEFHDSPEAVILMLRRYHAEVMRRSKLLAAAGVAAFDVDDPRVQKLGLKPMMAIVDECQMVLVPNTPIVPLVEEIVAIDRKTGAGLILATQIPQMKSLGGSVRIRDACVAGNALVLRLSNRGSGSTILPDDFVGDPFAIPDEIDGRTTAGMGYLRHAAQVGMLSRVPNLDEAAAAAAAPRTAVMWQVDPVDPNTPIKPSQRPTAAAGGGDGQRLSAGDRLRAAFGVGAKAKSPEPAPQPLSTPEWVLACLRRGPASAQALLDRPDCPVNQAQLYAVLSQLANAGRINAPAQRGGPYTIATLTAS